MQNIIQFQVRKGEKFYYATSLDLSIVTQAKTLDELTKNIQEAIDLHLEDEDSRENFSRPSVLMNYELPVYA